MSCGIAREAVVMNANHGCWQTAVIRFLSKAEVNCMRSIGVME
jgi:hypothetical protein